MKLNVKRKFHISRLFSALDLLMEIVKGMNDWADRWQPVRAKTSTTFANIGKFNNSDTSNQRIQTTVPCSSPT